jgi:hypothetical protein
MKHLMPIVFSQANNLDKEMKQDSRVDPHYAAVVEIIKNNLKEIMERENITKIL